MEKWKDVKEIKRLYKTGKFLQKELAKKFGVFQVNVSAICREHIWKHI